MAAKDDLAIIANRIRDLVRTEPKDDVFAVGVWRLVRKAIDLRAFADVRFTEFVAFFDPHRESETYNTKRAILSHQSVTPDSVSKLPLTMLEAMKWLADHGEYLGLSMPRSLPTLGDRHSKHPFESVTMRRCLEFRIRFPARATLRPHVEFLASLIDGKRMARPRPKSQNGQAGRPPIEGTKEERKLNLYDEWQNAKAARITMKDFCADPDNRKRGITEKQINNAVDFVYRRRRRGKL